MTRLSPVVSVCRPSCPFVTTGDDPEALRAAVSSTEAFLHDERDLALPRPPVVLPTTVPANFLGYRVTRAGVVVSRRTLDKVRRKATALRARGSERIERALVSWRGLPLG